MPRDNMGAGDAALRESRYIVAVADGVGGVVLPVALGEIASTLRDGDDLAVDLAGGGEVVLAGFFAAGGAALLVHGDGPGGVDEVLVGPGGGIVGAAPVAPGRLEGMFGAEAARAVAAFGADGVDGVRRRRDGLALAVQGGDGAGIGTPALVGSLLLLGVVVAACGGGGGGGGGQPETTAPVVPDPPLSGNAQSIADEIEAVQGGGGTWTLPTGGRSRPSRTRSFPSVEPSPMPGSTPQAGNWNLASTPTAFLARMSPEGSCWMTASRR